MKVNRYGKSIGNNSGAYWPVTARLTPFSRAMAL
jgi:hypothetical protein